jgi:hypothetical protein
MISDHHARISGSASTGFHVLLPDMRAVAAGGAGEIGPVVQQEGHVAGLRNGTQQLDRAPHRIVIGILEAQLHGADIAGIERHGKLVAKAGGVEARRRDEVEAAGRLRGLHGAARVSESRRPCHRLR